MFSKCPECATFNPAHEEADIRCRFCDQVYRPTPAELRQRRRAAEQDEHRREMHPWDLAASVSLAVVTAALLFGLSAWSPAPWARVTGFAFPVWVTFVAGLAWLVSRFDRKHTLAVLSRTSVVVLGLLLFPLLYHAVPFGRPVIDDGRPAAAVANAEGPVE